MIISISSDEPYVPCSVLVQLVHSKRKRKFEETVISNPEVERNLARFGNSEDRGISQRSGKDEVTESEPSGE
jgi:hypothetical protein